MREVIAVIGNKIPLGRRGENMATCVVFDISEWLKTYGEGTVQLIHQRNGDATPYPCVVEQDGSTVRWCIAGADVDVAGRGLAELQYYVGDVLVKSATYTTSTERAMGNASEEAPEPQKAWVEAMLKEAMDIAQNAADSEQAAQEQVVLAEAAKAGAERARDEARAEKTGAESAKTAAQSALTDVQNAIKNIPAGSTPIVNDLTTGGVSMALSAEMGKKLLPLDGSKPMTGALTMDRSGGKLGLSQFFKHNAGSTDYGTQVRDEDNAGNVSALVIRATAGKVLFYPDGNASKELLHTGNKPSGSYTGNGSAAARTIDVGGIGKFVAVYSNNAGTSPALIVTPLGAFGKNSSGVKALGYNDVRFADGVLTVASADNDVNANGKTYYYQVL